MSEQKLTKNFVGFRERAILRLIRALCGYTLKALGMRIGVSGAMIARWESGEAELSLSRYAELLAAMGFTPERAEQLYDIIIEFCQGNS